jgi:type IV fimbrial biogenesis protein FimT
MLKLPLPTLEAPSGSRIGESLCLRAPRVILRGVKKSRGIQGCGGARHDTDHAIPPGSGAKTGGGATLGGNPLRGFTLVELLITVAIMSLLIVMAAPNFTDWIKNQRIRTAAESLLNGLQIARAEALKTNSVVSFQVGSGNWTVVDRDSVQVQTGQWSQAGIGANTDTFSFNGLGRLTSSEGNISIFGADNTDDSACVAKGGKDRCLRIDIRSGGGVRLCDPALTTINPTDPQACPT